MKAFTKFLGTRLGWAKGFPIMIIFIFSAFACKAQQMNEMKPAAHASAVTEGHNPVKFLDLPIWQLKLLGIECSSAGIYYKNHNPNWNLNNYKYAVLCFCLTDDVYCKNLNFREDENIVAEKGLEKMLKIIPMTENTFDPVLITDENGKSTWDAYQSMENKPARLLPVRINLADLQMQKRKGWIIFWFRPTDSLRKVLSDITDIETYLSSPPGM